MDKKTLQDAKILWDYLKISQPLRKADCLIAMGSHDLRVGEYAARLFLEGWAPLLVCSGGLGRLTRGIWQEPEARLFAHTALKAGVPQEYILTEEQSTNTSENLLFSHALLEERGLAVHSAILVHKPYMERRALATAGIAWPELECLAASPSIAFEDYPTKEFQLEEVIHIMAGDFQRIIIYADKGWQTRQEIPPEALDAYCALIADGYDRYLVRER